MNNKIDMIGKTFNRLTVIAESGKKNGEFFWKCICSCGNSELVEVRGSNLRKGNTKSCGCLQKEIVSKHQKTKSIDLVGKVFGRLTVLREVERDDHNNRKWLCVCNCPLGSEVIVYGHNLKSGVTEGCGCNQVIRSSKINTKHGLSAHPLFNVWHNMVQRCHNPNSVPYKDYGGRGIEVCDRWREYPENFIEDMYPTFQKGLVLDRANNDGNYEPDNCRWVTSEQNNLNKRGWSNSSSKYKGVGWHKKINKWQARIKKGGRYCHLGYFSDEGQAAKVYNSAAKEMFGEFAYLNIIEEVAIQNPSNVVLAHTKI